MKEKQNSNIKLKYVESEELKVYSNKNIYILKSVTNKAGLSVKQVIEKKTKTILGIIIGGSDLNEETSGLGVFVK